MIIDRVINFLKPLTVILGVLCIVVMAQQQFPSGAGLPTGLGYVAPTLTVSTAGSGSAVLALSGNTSGTCTQTVSATSTTVTENCFHLAPFGSAAGPAYSFSGAPTTGIWGASSSLVFTASGINEFAISAAIARLKSTSAFGWASTGDAAGGVTDVAFSRTGPAAVALGSGLGGNTTGKLKASAYLSAGTTFTSNAGCTETALTGGGSVGKFTNGATGSCTTIITLGDTATAVNGWTGTVTDQTTAPATASCRVTASNATTATIGCTGLVASDIISFNLSGY